MASMVAEEEAVTAEGKLDAVWGRLGAAEAEPGVARRVFPHVGSVLLDVQRQDYSEILECPFDARTAAGLSERRLCSHGVVAKARLEFFDQAKAKYTGLFRSGADHCIVRLSTAIAAPGEAAGAEPEGTLSKVFASATSFAVGGRLRKARLFPCVAIKAFRAGSAAPSGNLLFAGSKTGQASASFLDHCVSTNLTEKVATPLKPVVKVFYKYSAHPMSLGLSEFATADADGRKLLKSDSENDNGPAVVSFPYCLVLKPATAVPPVPETARFDACFDALLLIDPKTVLYDVYAVPTPAACSTRIERIGRLVTTSPMRLSTPDDDLVFKHQAKEDDFALRPEWLQEIDAPVTDGKISGPARLHAGWALFERMIDAGRVIDLEKPSA